MKIYLNIISLIIGIQISYAQIGIGVTNPSSSLHIKSDNNYIMRLEDNINTSNNNWTIISKDTNGTFQKAETGDFRRTIIFNLPVTGATISTLSPIWQATEIKVKVPPGKWMVTGSIALIPNSSLATNGNVAYQCRMTLSDGITDIAPSSDLIGAYPNTGSGLMYGRVASPLPKDLVVGNIMIENKNLTTKDYYIIANIERIGVPAIGDLANIVFTNFASSSIPENQLYAIPINDN